MRTIAIIPARKNSKGVPGKNKRLLNGIPLVNHSIIFAQNNQHIEKVVLNTDDLEIINLSSLTFKDIEIYQRDDDLSKDDTPMVEVLLDYISNANPQPEFVILLQPTSPIRSHKDLDKMFELIKANPNIDCVLSIQKVPQHYSPQLMLHKNEKKLMPILGEEVPSRRQDVSPSYIRDGQIYIFRTTSLISKKVIITKNTYGLVSSKIGVNIDSEEDWTNAINLFKSK